ncbi:hypothetical protein Tco_0146054 [Tanacetum coccineum]
MASIFGSKSKSFRTMSIPPQDEPSISLPVSERPMGLELENQVQRLMEANLAPRQSVQVNKISSSCEIYSGPHDTQYCMENPEQAFVDYASSRLMSNFMASQDVRLSKFEANFKQQQGEMTNKIDTVLKAITDRIMGTLPSNTVKNPKLNVNSTSLVFSSRSYPTEDPQCSARATDKDHHVMVRVESERKESKGEEREEEGNTKNINTDSPLQPDPSILFITKKVHKLNLFLETLGLVSQSSDTEFVCTKGDDEDIMFIEIIKKYDDSLEEELKVEVNAMTEGLEDDRNFTYVIEFMIIEDISSIIDPRLSQVVLGKPFIEISNMTRDLSVGVVKFTDRINEISYKMPHKIEKYDSLSDLEKEHTKSVYLRNEKDKRRGVEYVMKKILGLYKECLELGPEYLTGVSDEGGVT